MQNFIAQSMRRFGLAPENKSAAATSSPSRMGQSNAPLAHMEVGSKWSYSTLQYPLDIQSRTDLGHYMMFYINVPNNSEFGRKGGVGDKKNYVLDDSGDEDLGSRTLQEKQVMGDAKISTKSKDGHYDAKGQSWKPGTPNKVIDRAAHQGTAATALGKNHALQQNKLCRVGSLYLSDSCRDPFRGKSLRCRENYRLRGDRVCVYIHAPHGAAKTAGRRRRRLCGTAAAALHDDAMTCC